jgi:hypothetical protein
MAAVPLRVVVGGGRPLAARLLFPWTNAPILRQVVLNVKRRVPEVAQSEVLAFGGQSDGEGMMR